MRSRPVFEIGTPVVASPARAMGALEQPIITAHLLGVRGRERRDRVIELRRLSRVAGQLSGVARTGVALGENLAAEHRVFPERAPGE